MIEAKFSWIMERAEGTTALVRFYELQVPTQRQTEAVASRRRLICERQVAFSRPISRRALAANVNNLAHRVAAEHRLAIRDADYIQAE